MRVTTQAELDAAVASGATYIEIDSPRGVWLKVATPRSARVVARGSSSVVARGSSSVVAWGSSSVEAWGSSSVVARGSSSVVARGSSSVVAWESSSVEARGSSSVVARESSSVVAWESSSVEARGSSSVVAWESSSVEARGSSSVVATPHVAVHLHSARATIKGGVVIDVTRVNDSGEEWCRHHGIEVSRAGVATVYKAVGDNYVSGWGMAYKPGTKPSAPDWRDDQDCGHGLHFSPTPKQAREYNTSATRFLAVGVKVADLRPIPGGTAKCKAPRVVRACVEVDIDGKPVTR